MNKGEKIENKETRNINQTKTLIIEMVSKIKNPRYLKMIYGYVNSAYQEEKQGN